MGFTASPAFVTMNSRVLRPATNPNSMVKSCRASKVAPLADAQRRAFEHDVQTALSEVHLPAIRGLVRVEAVRSNVVRNGVVSLRRCRCPVVPRRDPARVRSPVGQPGSGGRRHGQPSTSVLAAVDRDSPDPRSRPGCSGDRWYWGQERARVVHACVEQLGNRCGKGHRTQRTARPPGRAPLHDLGDALVSA